MNVRDNVKNRINARFGVLVLAWFVTILVAYSVAWTGYDFLPPIEVFYFVFAAMALIGLIFVVKPMLKSGNEWLQVLGIVLIIVVTLVLAEISIPWAVFVNNLVPLVIMMGALAFVLAIAAWATRTKSTAPAED